ncbi:hypothetical protein vBCjeMWX1_0098 [Campylobacter phage vB_CjeM_WX1]|nr:hypothetical protein vBCjeMWX1_0098 [Campylobacter phage vB_CjeM_WX1]
MKHSNILEKDDKQCGSDFFNELSDKVNNKGEKIYFTFFSKEYYLDHTIEYDDGNYYSCALYFRSVVDKEYCCMEVNCHEMYRLNDKNYIDFNKFELHKGYLCF